MSKKGGGGVRGTSTKKVGGGSSTSSSDGRAEGRRVAEWRRHSVALPTSSLAEEVVSTDFGTQDTPVSFAQVAAQPSAEAISGVARLAPSSFSGELHQSTLAESVGTSVGTETVVDRPVIAVSTMKGPAAFFNLARKFLVTYETCDLSALEGAIVSAIDAAHLLERSRLATIVRIETSYVPVEPRRKRQGAIRTRMTPVVDKHEDKHHKKKSHIARHTTHDFIHTHQTPPIHSGAGAGYDASPSESLSQSQRIHDSVVPEESTPKELKPEKSKGRESARGKELRRARIVVTVRRTDEYRQWLEENSLHEASGDGTTEPENASRTESSTLPPTK